jgi:hypothetical protein
MGAGGMVGWVAAFRLGLARAQKQVFIEVRGARFGRSRLWGSQASKYFDAKNAENHGIPRRKARIALRAKHFFVWREQHDAGVCAACCPVAFLRRASWFFVFSVINACLLLAPDEDVAIGARELRI